MCSSTLSSLDAITDLLLFPSAASTWLLHVHIDLCTFTQINMHMYIAMVLNSPMLRLALGMCILLPDNLDSFLLFPYLYLYFV